jgi:hypothetical protein
VQTRRVDLNDWEPFRGNKIASRRITWTLRLCKVIYFSNLFKIPWKGEESSRVLIASHFQAVRRLVTLRGHRVSVTEVALWKHDKLLTGSLGSIVLAAIRHGKVPLPVCH